MCKLENEILKEAKIFKRFYPFSQVNFPASLIIDKNIAYLITFINWNNATGNIFDKVQCAFHIPLGRLYAFSNYETGQYGHEPFDFIILRNEEQDILQVGKTIAEPQISNIYLPANSNITGIINTDSASMNLTIMPEFPCFFKPCTNAECEQNLNKQHRFECTCNTGYLPSNDTLYKCQGKFFYKNVLQQLKLRRNIN